MKNIKSNFTLDNQSIFNQVALFENLLKEARMEKKNILGLSLSFEEILLRWQDHFGPQTQLTMTAVKRMGQLHISLALPGESCDPLTDNQEEDNLVTRILQATGLNLNWEYRKGTNYLWLKAKTAPKNALAQLLLGIGSALLLGIAGLFLFPVMAQQSVTFLLTPLRSTLFGMLSAVAVPLIFLSVMLGICNVGDRESFSKIGKHVLIRFISIPFLTTIVVGLLSLPFFPLKMSTADMNTSAISQILNLLLEMMPKNLFEPFLTGNTLQLIVLAVFVGLAVLLLGSRANLLVKLAEQLRSCIETLLCWIAALMPIMVFLVVLETIWSGNAHALLGIWKPLLLLTAAVFVIILIWLLTISRRFHLKPVRLLRLLLPTMMIGFSTSSSSMAFHSNLNCCEKDLGINPKISRIGIPLGTVIFSPTGGSQYLLAAFYCAVEFGTECSLVWIIVAILSSYLFKLAAPPVGGGNIACIAVLFSQMGIPAGAIAIAMAMDILADRVNSLSKLCLMQLEMVSTADKMDLLDHETLKRSAG